MNTITKHKAVWDWLQACDAIGDLSFNFLTDDVGGVALIPQNNFVDEAVSDFIDGTSERNYLITFVCLADLTAEKNVTFNIDVIESINEIISWIEAQNELRNFPPFPEGCAINNIEAISNGEDVATESDTLVRYSFTIKIEYTKGV